MRKGKFSIPTLKFIQDEKLALLDQLVVLEGLLDELNLPLGQICRMTWYSLEIYHLELAILDN